MAALAKANVNGKTATVTKGDGEAAAPAGGQLVIKRMNFKNIVLPIRGTTASPYVQLRFSQKAIEAMAEKMAAGSKAAGRRQREARDFDADFRASYYQDKDGRFGIPAPSFRNAMISACRVAGFAMTRAKLSVFVEADTTDATDGTPLVFIKGTPVPLRSHVRNDTGVADIRVRAQFVEWECNLRLSWDADQFGAEDVINLLARAGKQVGVGEGRPDSKTSNGMGWGTFELIQGHDIGAAITG